MLYKIKRKFHFLGIDIIIPLDVEASSYTEAKDTYNNTFSNFNRMKNFMDYLKKNNLTEILGTIPPESEESALICVEDITDTPAEEKHENYPEGYKQSFPIEVDPETNIGLPPLIFRDGTSFSPELTRATKEQSSEVYHIKIVNHEPIILSKPKSNSSEKITIDGITSDCRLMYGKRTAKAVDDFEVLVEKPVRRHKRYREGL